MIKPYKRNPIKTTNRRPTNYSRLPHVASLSSPTRCSYSFSFHLHDRCHALLQVCLQSSGRGLDQPWTASLLPVGEPMYTSFYTRHRQILYVQMNIVSVLLCSNKNIINGGLVTADGGNIKFPRICSNILGNFRT